MIACLYRNSIIDPSIQCNVVFLHGASWLWIEFLKLFIYFFIRKGQCKIILESQMAHYFLLTDLFLCRIPLCQFGKIMFLGPILSMFFFRHQQLIPYRFCNHRFWKLQLLPMLDTVLYFSHSQKVNWKVITKVCLTKNKLKKYVLLLIVKWCGNFTNELMWYDWLSV